MKIQPRLTLRNHTPSFTELKYFPRIPFNITNSQGKHLVSLYLQTENAQVLILCQSSIIYFNWSTCTLNTMLHRTLKAKTKSSSTLALSYKSKHSSPGRACFIVCVILTSRCSNSWIFSSFFFISSLSCFISFNKSSFWSKKKYCHSNEKLKVNEVK